MRNAASGQGRQVLLQLGVKAIGRNPPPPPAKKNIARSWNILLDQKGGHNSCRKQKWEMRPVSCSVLLLLKNIPGSDNVNAEDITEWMSNDEIDELIQNDTAEILTVER